MGANESSPSSSSTSTTSSAKSTVSENTSSKNVLHVGDTWTVPGQWKLTIKSVTPTSDRNQFSDKKPAQVLLVTYSYENLGYYSDIYKEDSLYFSLDPTGDATVIDSKGELGFSYPADQTYYPQETPKGAKCANAQAVVGLHNVSKKITMNISKYDGKSVKQTVQYELDVK